MLRILLPLILILPWPARAQDDACGAGALQRQQETLAGYLRLDFADDLETALANLFRLGALYQAMALDCGYAPNAAEVNAMLERVLDYASLDDLIAAQSVGDDVEAILLELQDVYGDPLTGQLLYNGLEATLGGNPLGCAGCHENEAIAPLTAGTWTRIDDARLKLPQFADYSHQAVSGGEHRAADGLHHAGICRGDAGVLWQSVDNSAVGGSGGVPGESGSAA